MRKMRIVEKGVIVVNWFALAMKIVALWMIASISMKLMWAVLILAITNWWLEVARDYREQLDQDEGKL